MPEELLGLEVSLNHIRYSVVKKSKKELVVKKSGKVNLPAFSLSSPGDITKALQTILALEKISPAKICLTLSAEDLFIQQVTLPKIAEGELKGMIRNQIERIPKFANKEFDFTHAEFASDEYKRLVISCALTHEQRDFYLEGVGRAGFSIESLQISPFNSLELFYSRLSKTAVEGLVVLGDTTSRIMIFWQNECKMFFQMAVGKKDLYASAREIKNSVLLSWVEEMRRIVKSYQAQNPKRPLERMFLVWDNENALDLAEMVSKSLEIEMSAPRLEEFGLTLKEDFGNPVYFLSLAGPLAYFRGIKQKFNFGVFLRKIKLKEAIKKTGRFILLYSTAALILSLAALFWLTGAKKSIAQKERMVSEKILVLERQTTQLKAEKDQLVAMRDLLLAQANFVRRFNKVSWSRVFGYVIDALPNDVTMNQFELTESLEVKLHCATFSISSIAEFIRAINKNPLFESAQFDFLKEREIEGKKNVDFSLRTKFKNNEP